MPFFRDNKILGIAALVLLAVLTFLLFAYPRSFAQNPPLFYSIVSAVVLSFNIVIILSWISLGIFTAIAISAVSFLVSLAGVLRSGAYPVIYLVLSFFAAVFLGVNHWKRSVVLKDSFRLESEKLDEDINILSDESQKKKKEIMSLEERFARYLVLKDVAEALTTTLTLEEIVKLVVERVVFTLKKEARVLLYLVDAVKQELMLSASRDASKVKAKKGDIFDNWVLKHSLPLIVEDVRKDFRFSVSEEEEAREPCLSIIEVPLLSGNKVIGTLRMDSPLEKAFTQDDLRLLDIVGGLGAVAIENAFLYTQVQELAIKDSLTGLFVRRYFMKRFQEEILRSSKKKEQLSLLMMDIDKFKWYNDKYGHATGDLVLRHITSIIIKSLKQGDMAARYGGEEMAVLLLGCDHKKALRQAESIRKKIENNPLVVRRETHNVTISIGVATYPDDSISEEELIKAADERLYKAKAQGRNRVCAD